MSISPLQEPFLRELAANFHATRDRILARLTSAEPATREVVEGELRGLYHGLLVIFDGGTALADLGLIRIVDEDGTPFARHLHEICFSYWDKKA